MCSVGSGLGGGGLAGGGYLEGSEWCNVLPEAVRVQHPITHRRGVAVDGADDKVGGGFVGPKF